MFCSHAGEIGDNLASASKRIAIPAKAEAIYNSEAGQTRPHTLCDAFNTKAAVSLGRLFRLDASLRQAERFHVLSLRPGASPE